jgi:SAM-dependent methyltransferase
MKHFKVWFVILSTSLALNTFAQSYVDGGDDKYNPRIGQEGKDVVWVPTGNELLANMLKTAKVTSNDLVYDLGSGDGRIAIAAAKDFGARAIGIEVNPEMAKLAPRNADRSGVSDRVKIIKDLQNPDAPVAPVMAM